MYLSVRDATYALASVAYVPDSETSGGASDAVALTTSASASAYCALAYSDALNATYAPTSAHAFAFTTDEYGYRSSPGST